MHINEKIKLNRKHRNYIWMALWSLLFAFNISLLFKLYSPSNDTEIIAKYLCIASMLMILFCFISLPIVYKAEEKYDLAKHNLQDIRKNDKIKYKIEKKKISNKYNRIEYIIVLFSKIINTTLIIDNIVIFLVLFS